MYKICKCNRNTIWKNSFYKKCFFPIFFRKKQNPAETATMIETNAWYYILPTVFQYLETNELVKVAQVCKTWCDAAAHPSLWKTVRLKKCQITNWEHLKNILQKQCTQNLVLRDIWMDNKDKFWHEFFTLISKVTSLIKLELCECSPDIVDKVIQKCPQLKVLNAMWINGGGVLSSNSIRSLQQCEELQLRCKCKSVTCSMFSYDSLLLIDLSCLQQLIHLRHLVKIHI